MLRTEKMPKRSAPSSSDRDVRLDRRPISYTQSLFTFVLRTRKSKNNKTAHQNTQSRNEDKNKHIQHKQEAGLSLRDRTTAA